MNVGFVGLGTMGLPMAGRVLAAGLPLSVWNRTPAKAAGLADLGARVAASPADLAAGSDVVITMLSDGSAVEGVLLREEGLLPALAPGAVVIDMSTIGPDAARRLGTLASERDITFVDSPVSGSVALAEQGALLAMVGGDETAFARVQPILGSMTKMQFHLGPTGAGAAMKLAINTVIAVTNESIAEALVFAERSGIPREAAYDVLSNGAVASPFVLYKRKAFLEPGAEPVAFTIALMRKDLDLALEIAGRLDTAMPATEAARGMLERAADEGLADADFARVAELIRRSGTPTTERPEERL